MYSGRKKAVNVLLIRPPDPMQEVELLSHTKPMNLAYLAANLRKDGFGVAILDYENNIFSEQALFETLKNSRPDLVGVSCVTPTIKNGAMVCELVKKFNSRIITVAGGPHVNALPVETLTEFPSFDCVIYGEGEITLNELCMRVSEGGNPDGIDGLAYRQSSEIILNQPRQLLQDLDILPFPARDLIDFRRQAGHSTRGVSNSSLSAELFTSRGCPFGCAFCAIQATFGKSVRFRGLDSLEEEVRQMMRAHCFDHVIIADDTFSLKADRAFAICEMLKRNSVKSWSCDTRISSVSEDLLRAMKQSGCTKVAFGVESGSQRITDLNGKKIDVSKVGQAVNWAKKAGIRHIEGNFIIGSDPSETMADIEMTQDMVRSLPWTFISVTVIVPYPGTPVFTKMKASGQIDQPMDWQDFVIFGKRPRWHTDNFSADDLVNLQKRLTREFYLRPGYIVEQIKTVRSFDDLRYWVNAGATYLKWYIAGRL